MSSVEDSPIMDTNTSQPDRAQDEDPAASWTNEMLSMPMRRQLLDRELRKVTEGKRAHGHDGRPHDDRHAGDHPHGQGEAGEHGS
jgi:hypothetical protein